MKLWQARVTYDVDVVIASEDEPCDMDWQDAARQEIDDRSYSMGDVGRARQVKSPTDLPRDWVNAIPRGDVDNDRTCLGILLDQAVALAEVRVGDPRQVGLFCCEPAIDAEQAEQVRRYQTMLAQVREANLVKPGKPEADLLRMLHCAAQSPGVVAYFDAPKEGD